MNNSHKPPVIFLMGPTASGKTHLAIELVKHLPVDIISVDSALVYRDMNIGTAKPTAQEQALAPHRLIDICDPAQPYSVADFCRDARAEIEQSVAQGRIPLLVGGTMMYFKTLLEGLSDMPATDSAIREQIYQEAAEKGWPELHKQLQAVDPKYAAELHPNHSHRIGRALELYRMSGKSMSHFRQASPNDRWFTQTYRPIQLALIPPERSVLHERIEKRFLAMLKLGFVEEVRALLERGDLHSDLPAMRSVGYRQVWDYLAQAYDYETMIDKGVAATRQLAKRQLTWLRGWDDLFELPADEASMQKNLEKTLKFLKKESIY